MVVRRFEGQVVGEDFVESVWHYVVDYGVVSSLFVLMIWIPVMDVMTVVESVIRRYENWRWQSLNYRDS